MVYLRARYYAPGMGRFLTRDTWEGDVNRPLSLNKWSYVEENPINLIDPSGQFPFWCKSMSSRLDYENCVRKHYNLSAPRDYPVMPQEKQDGFPGCWSGPVAYKTAGYLEGYSVSVSIMFGYSTGEELVFDFGTMEKGFFGYETLGITFDMGVSVMAYHGLVYGFNNVDSIESKYRGQFWFVSAGVSTEFPFPTPNVGTGVNYFRSVDGELSGISQYYSAGLSILSLIPINLAGGGGTSTPLWSKSYINSAGVLNSSRLLDDIAADPASPVWPAIILPSALFKAHGMVLATHYSRIYREMHDGSK
jgi:hypothetical protein